MFPLLQSLPDLLIKVQEAAQAHEHAAKVMHELAAMIAVWIPKDDPRYKK